MADGRPPGVRDPAHRVDLYCDGCGTYDRHPRHTFLGTGGTVTHKHMDCCHASGNCPDPHGLCATIMMASHRAHGDALVAWLEGRMAALGGGLTAWLQAGAPVMGGASGLDQARVVDWLNVIVGESAPGAGTAVLANGFTSGASSHGHIRLMTVNGSSTSNGTELSGGSYIPGTGIVYTTGTGGQFTAAAYSSGSGSTQTNANLSQAGMPAATTVGIEIWDSAGTPLRWAWAALATPVTTSSGNTLTFASGAILASLIA